MKNLFFAIVGILFGIIMTKSEAISWFRIQEMFRFQSFHMYGIIGVAVTTGVLLHLYLKKFGLKTMDGTDVVVEDKPKLYKAALLGGTVFGLGWAMTGACPGPLYVLLGNGHLVILVILLSALAGTWLYGLLQDKLPH